MEEIWKYIEGFNEYKVSNLGRILSLKSNKYLTPYKNREYLMVRLYGNNTTSNCYVHRLVAKAFIPNYDNLIEINHKDENKTNNIFTNLEWCNRLTNCNYGSRNLRIGIASKTNKLKSVKQLSKDGTLLQIFNSINAAGEYLGKNPSHISSCCTGKRNFAFGYKWEYVDN